MLAGLKGELCRRYAVGEVTYYKLRDRFIAAGMEGLYSSGHTKYVKAMEDRIRDLERALGRKSLEVEFIKNVRGPQTIAADELRELVSGFAAQGLARTQAAELLGIPRQRLYPRDARVHAPPPDSGRDAEVVAVLRELLAEEPRRRHFGYRRWQAVLGRRKGIVVNHKRMRRLLHVLGWTQQRVPKGHRVGVARPGNPSGPNQVWQIDMTKVPVEGTGWLHHIAVVDMFTREVVGHFEGMRARAVEWRQALDQAVLDRFPDGSRGQGLTIQADNGCHPTARAFRNALHTLGIQLAFIDVCEPKQNAIVERYFRTLKEEEIWPTIYETVGQARDGIADFVRFYNQVREHSSLGYIPPTDFFTAARARNQDAA